MDVGGAVAGELDGEHPAAAAHVQAALVGADALPVEVLPDEEAALRRREHAGVDGDVREVEREHRAPAGVGPARRVAALALGGGELELVDKGVDALGAGLRVRERPAGVAHVGRADAAAGPDDLRALLAPLQRELGELLAVDPRLVAPPGRGEVAEVRVDAERQVGEVA